MKQVHGWWLPDEDTHFEHYFNAQKHSEYQLQQRQKALAYVDKFDLALDIGGHVGFWSKPLSEKFAKVIAFEPHQPFIDLFTLNAPKAEIIKVALGETEGQAELKTPTDNSGMAYLQEGSGVPIKTLDSYGFNDIDFIKIDCEGYEFPIVKGASQTLKRCRPVVIVEQKLHKSHTNWWSKTAAVEYMVNVLNYRVVGRVLQDWVLKKI
jgi:FkbM family methyltransferase